MDSGDLLCRHGSIQHEEVVDAAGEAESDADLPVVDAPLQAVLGVAFVLGSLLSLVILSVTGALSLTGTLIGKYLLYAAVVASTCRSSCCCRWLYPV